MATDKKDFGVDFVNITMKYDVELLENDGEHLEHQEAFSWIEEANRRFIKISFSYSERSHSIIATATDGGSRPANQKPLCLSQHSGSPYGALKKLYFLIEILGGGSINPDRINLGLADREDYVTQKLAGMFKKKS